MKGVVGAEDWGGASFAPIPLTLAGGWSGAEPAFLLQHEEKLWLGAGKGVFCWKGPFLGVLGSPKNGWNLKEVLWMC